ncbi:hypothetical protein B0H10DRAFT_2195696 [Mycena sp. CBHHK59/15]|nr:hypothetical protein B0H10DRAFT_2195696 [Mycena sp. CBHHK59/15]
MSTCRHMGMGKTGMTSTILTHMVHATSAVGASHPDLHVPTSSSEYGYNQDDQESDLDASMDPAPSRKLINVLVRIHHSLYGRPCRSHQFQSAPRRTIDSDDEQFEDEQKPLPHARKQKHRPIAAGQRTSGHKNTIQELSQRRIKAIQEASLFLSQSKGKTTRNRPKRKITGYALQQVAPIVARDAASSKM